MVGVHNEREPPWPFLWDLFLRGRLIPFLGAAASSFGSNHGNAPPTGSTLIYKLAEMAQLQLDCGTPGCTQSQFDLPRLASFYQTCIATRPLLEELLKTEIANPSFAPNSLHRLLARIARRRPLLIITTNYDDLLERAFDSPDDGSQPVPYEVVVTPADDLAYAQRSDDMSEPGPEHAGAVRHWISGEGQPDFEDVLGSELCFDLDKRTIIYKIHGSVPRGPSWQGGYLIAEEDYARFLGRMDRGGIVPEPIMALISKKIKVAAAKKVPFYSLLFLGYGMHDWNTRVLLEELQVGRRLAGEELHYAFMRKPNPIEKRLLEKRSVEVYDCELSRFVAKLSEFG